MSTYEARTLAEAFLFLDLAVAGGERNLGAALILDPMTKYATAVETIEDADGWRIRYADAERAIDLQITRAGEAEAEENDSEFGTGASELIDAGQWVLIRDNYMRQAMAAELHFAGRSADRSTFEEAVRSWDLAQDASEQIMHFLEGSEDRVGADACWTAMGRSLLQRLPDKLTRLNLMAEDDFCRESRAEFIDSVDHL